MFWWQRKWWNLGLIKITDSLSDWVRTFRFLFFSFHNGKFSFITLFLYVLTNFSNISCVVLIERENKWRKFIVVLKISCKIKILHNYHPTFQQLYLFLSAQNISLLFCQLKVILYYYWKSNIAPPRMQSESLFGHAL